MTPAEKRIKDQIDRWLTSLDLHLQYLDLNDFAYNRVQPWPVHDRPTRLVLDLAKQKALELKAVFESRLTMGDAKFAEALELMAFLANLVGSQNLQRFIPLADPERQTTAQTTTIKPTAAPTASVVITQRVAPANNAAANDAAIGAKSTTAIKPPPAKPAPQAPVPKPQTTKAAVSDDEATREMPRLQRPPPPVHAAAPSKIDATRAAPKQDPRKAPSRGTSAPKQSSGNKSSVANELQMQIITDAVRLLNWGRPWHELAETIARMADRPPLPEIRRILRGNRADIERRAAEPQP